MLTAVLLSALCGLVSSVFLRVDDTQRRCFTQDLPDRTRLVGLFWTRLYHEQRDEYLPVDPDLEINVMATDPDEQLVLSGSYSSEGRFTFTSRRPGQHQVCLQSNSSQRPLPAGGTLALHLDIRVGDRTLTQLQLRVRLLTEQVYQIQKEQDHHTLRLNDLRHVNFSTNKLVFWWVVIGTLYMVMVAVVTWNPSWIFPPGEGRHGEQPEQKLQAVEAEQDGAEEKLQPQDEGLQQQEVDGQRRAREEDEERRARGQRALAQVPLPT